MLIKSLILASAMTLLMGGAALAQESPYDPNSSARSPLAVNPLPPQSPPRQTAETGDRVPTSASVPAYVPLDAVIMAPIIVTNGPVPDTPENRARYGQPDSRTGKMTRPAGN